MSLINEALQRARGEAQRQAEAERSGTAPAPTWTPPPFSRRERSPVVVSVLASLAASTVVLGLGLYVSRRRAQPDSAPQASSASSVPLAATAAPAAPAPREPPTLTTPVRSQAAVAPVKRPAATSRAVDSGAIAEPSAAAKASPREAALATAHAPAPRPAARRGGELNGKSFVHLVTLESGARIELGGIVSGATPLAMLNGHVLGIGEFVEDCAVVKVEARRVELHGADGTFWIELQ